MTHDDVMKKLEDVEDGKLRSHVIRILSKEVQQGKISHIIKINTKNIHN